MKRRRYYVNTNFVVDLWKGRSEATAFALSHRGELYTSKLLIREFSSIGAGWAARRICAEYDIQIVRLSKIWSNVKKAAFRAILESGAISPNTVLDYLHVYTAVYTGAEYFVTADAAACNRALRAGLCCINHRRGTELCP